MKNGTKLIAVLLCILLLLPTMAFAETPVIFGCGDRPERGGNVRPEWEEGGASEGSGAVPSWHFRL